MWPDVAVQPRLTAPDTERYVRSYLVMRVGVGVLGIAVPLLLVFGEPLLFDGQPFLRGLAERVLLLGGARAVRRRAVRDRGLPPHLQGRGALAREQTEHPRRRRRHHRRVVPDRAAGEGRDPRPRSRICSARPTVERIHFTAAAVFIASLAVISYYFARPPLSQGRAADRARSGGATTSCVPASSSPR